MSEIEPQKLAETIGTRMYARDYAAQALGIKLDEVRPGYARMTMTVRGDMLNGHDMCHGGLIFTLADSAFAYACNSTNVITVAQHCSVSFIAPAMRGDVLTAVAEERHRQSRTGLTDVTVTDQTGKLVAIFRGHSYALRGEVVRGLGTVGQAPED